MAEPYNCQDNLAHRNPAHGEEAYGHGNGQTERKCQLGFDCHSFPNDFYKDWYLKTRHAAYRCSLQSSRAPPLKRETQGAAVKLRPKRQVP